MNPENDHTPDPGVICWVTGNPPPGSNPLIEEVDGRTVLVSPVLDLEGASLARGSVWLWAFANNPKDHLDFEVSSDNGATWATIERISGIGLNQWIEYPFFLGPFGFSFTSQVRFRVLAEDTGGDNIVDCAMDDFFLEVLTPGSADVASGAPAGRPASYQLEESRPNPFNPRTEIRYQLPERTAVRLAVFDVAGREVRVLVDAVEGAGEHGAVWDGKDARGKVMSSGVYFYRLKAGEFEETRRVTLVK
jgi:hypothetical protein